MLSPQPHQDKYVAHTHPQLFYHPLTCYVCVHSKFLVNSLDAHHRVVGIVPCSVAFAAFRAGKPRPTPILDCFAHGGKRVREGGLGVTGGGEAVDLVDSDEED